MVVKLSQALMAQRTRPGAWTRAWKNLTESFQKRNRTVVGQDQFGNVYYEEAPRPGPSTHHSRAKAVSRGFDAPSGAQERNVPVEWESWMKGTRQTPPTDEEIARSLARLAASQQLRIDSQTEKRAPTVSVEGPPTDTQQKAYPKYDDYESIAGAKDDSSKPSS
uniref:NADH dehydrogenase [ubiquinone] 1 alpha subcomplex assembly factor 2 n=1 Tax=Plectus sambesii TaxID=2011161 RepID=A0A914VR69_9BILA